MDPRYQSSIEQAVSRYIKLLNLKSNKFIRSPKAKHLLRELRQLLYGYLGVNLPETLNEVVPMLSLSELASNKVYETAEFDELLERVENLVNTVHSESEDEQLDKVKSRVFKMLRIYHKQQNHKEASFSYNITNI